MVEIDIIEDDAYEKEVLEHVQQSYNNGTIQVKEANDLAESMKELNDDSLEPHSNMSKIDMKTRLHPNEIEGVLGIDTLVSMGVLTKRCLDFTRQKKRLAVSELGKGRSEFIELVRGKQEQDSKGSSAFEKMGNLFTRGKQ